MLVTAPTTFGQGACPCHTPAPYRWLAFIALTLVPFPANADDVTAKLADVEAEISALRKADPAQAPAAAPYADQLEREVRQLRTEWDAPADGQGGAPDAAPEVYVVGFYEGSMPNGPKKFGTAAVEVQVTDRPVVLALCAYEPIRWDLRLAPGVRIQRLIVSGYGEQILEPAPPAGVPIETHVARAGAGDYFYTYPKAEDDSGTVPAAERLHGLTGLPITTLQGGYRYGGQPVVVGPRDTDWRRQRVTARLDPLWREATAPRRAEARGAVSKVRFTAIRWKGDPMFPRPEAELAEFTPVGWTQGAARALPRGVNRVAQDPRGPTWFGLVSRSYAARLDLAAGQAIKIEVKEDIPEFSWPCGLAFDTKRNRLLVSTFGGEGFLYACDTAADKWSILCGMDNIDLASLAYSAEEDCLYGVKMNHGRGGLTICQFRPDGQFVRELRINADVPFEPSAAIETPIQVVPVGKQLVMLVPPSRQQMMAVARNAMRARMPRGAPGGHNAPAAARDIAAAGAAAAAAAAGETVAPMRCLVVNAADGAVTYSGEMTAHSAGAAGEAPAEGRKLQEQWAALRRAPPADAEKALPGFTVGGDGAVAVVRAALPPPPEAPNEASLKAVLAKLESDDWKRREEAAADLVATGAAVEPALRAALAAVKSQDARQRLEVVLNKIQSLRGGGATAAEIDEALGDSPLRARLRAVRALGRIGTPAAAQLLREIAGGAPGSLDALHARVALQKF